jgi:diadenosine tetraphosphate (Ap4A) HIT family hydrolase
MMASKTNATIMRFGYPDTLVHETDHWVVLLRPDQVTLGSLVLAAKSDATSFGTLDPAAFADLANAVRAVEQALLEKVVPAKLNYLMLMMVDPHVHFHVFPRYVGSRSFGTLTLADEGWPKAPALSSATALTADQIADLAAWLQEGFAKSA